MGPGSYSYSGEITNDGLTLDGAGMDSSTINGGNYPNINATDVTLRDIKLDSGGGLALRVEANQEANGLRIINVKTEDATIGIEIDAGVISPDKADGLYIENFHAINHTFKGIYLERATNATIKDVYVDGILDDPNKDNYANTGIDVNLKYSDYRNITIQDSTVKRAEEGDVGSENKFGLGSSIHSALAIKARGSSDDDTSYNSTSASLDGVLVENVTVIDSTNGLRVGESGVNYVDEPGGPKNVTITKSTFQNNERYHIEDLSDSVDLEAVESDSTNTFDRTVSTDIGIYSSIQPAIDTASIGDTIEVGPGTYNENIQISHGLNLIGSGPGQTSIAPSSGRGIDIRAQTSNVENLTIEGFSLSVSDNSIVVQSNSQASDGYDGINYTYRDLVIDSNGNDQSAVGLFDVRDATLDNVTVRNSSRTDAGAIEMIGVKNLAITESRIVNNVIGVKMFSFSGYEANENVTIKNSVISGNSDVGIRNEDTNAPIDATNNWWGSSNGPNATTNTYNDENQSGKISADVEFTPWLDAPFDQGGKEFAPVKNDTDGQFASIQAAVDAAEIGDTIEVGSGTFEEQVIIDRDLTINGNGENSRIVSPEVLSTNFTYPNPGGASEEGYSVLLVKDSEVNINNLKINGSGEGDNNKHFFGVSYVNSSGIVDKVNITSVRDEPMQGNQHGVAFGAFNDDGADKTVTLQNSTLVDYQKNGFVARGGNLTVQVLDNDVFGIGPTDIIGQNGIQLGYSATGVIKKNTVKGHVYTPTPKTTQPANIILYGHGSSKTIIHNNTIKQGEVGIAVAGPGNVSISDNRFTNNSWHVLDYHAPPTFNHSLNAENISKSNQFTDGHAYIVDETGAVDHSVYGSLQTALDGGAGDVGATDGDTIDIGPGTYEESVTLGTQNITLQGSDTTTVDGRIDIPKDGATVRNLTVRNGAPSGSDEVEGIFIGNSNGFSDTSEDIVVQNVTIEDIHPHGTTNTLEGIHVKHYDAGDNVTGVKLSDVTIRNVTQPNAGANGIKLQAGIQDVTTENTDIEDISGSWAYGVVATPSSNEAGVPENVVVTKTSIQNITTNGGSGVGVGIDGSDENGYADPEAVTLRRNDFENNDIAALNKNESSTLDAVENWWGSANGPNATKNTYNVGNQGGIVSGDVEFTPWLNASADGENTIKFAPVENSSSGQFASIQAAVDAARSGDTIEVGPGTYTENVTIDTAGVTLESTDGANSTTIDAPAGVTNVVEIDPSANNVTIDGFTIQNGERRGIFVGTFSESADNVTIENNRIVDNGKSSASAETHGILVEGGNNSIVRDNLIANIHTGGDDRASGISIVEQNEPMTSSNVLVANNTVRNVTSPSASEGKVNAIELSHYVEGAVIRDNTLESLTANKATGVRTIEEDGTNNGPSNFTIIRNDIDDITGDTDENAIAIGGYTGLGDSHEVSQNNFHEGMVAYYLSGDGDTLDATANWWGHHTGPSGEGPGDGSAVTTNVEYEPWLDAPYPDGEPTSPTTFSITQFDSSAFDSDLPVGEEATITVEIKNEGDIDGVKPVWLNVTSPEHVTIARFGVEGGLGLTANETFTETVPIVPSSGFEGQTVTIELDATDEQATGTVNVTSSETAFEVVQGTTNISSGSGSASGEQISVDATIENTGTVSGSQPIELVRTDAGGTEEVVDSTDATLNAGETIDLTLTDIPSANYEGEKLTYNVSTPISDVESGTVDILESARFNVTDTNLSTVGSVVSGDSVTVNATVKNEGGVESTGTVRLTLEGSTAAKSNVTLDRGDSQSLALVATTDDLEPGARDIAVRTDNATVRDTVQVQAPAEFVPTITSVSDPIAGEEDVTVDVDVENVGDVGGSTTVKLIVPGVGTDTTTNNIDGDGTESVSLSVGTTTDDIGDQPIFVKADGETVENETSILAPAEIDVEIEGATDPIVATQDTLAVDIGVENDGGVEASNVKVDLALDGTNRKSRTVTVGAESDSTVTLKGITIGQALEGDLELNATATHDSTVFDTQTVTVLEAPDDALFRVSDLSLTDNTVRKEVVRDGGNVEVEATVENIGDLEGEQSVSLIVDGEGRDETSVSLGSGETSTVTFTLDPSDLRLGDRKIGIESADSQRTSTVTVRDADPATYEVQTESPDTLNRSETVTATVENVGDLSGTQTVEFKITIDGETLRTSSRSVSLGVDETETVDVTVPDETRAGEFDATLEASTANETDSAETTIDYGTIGDGLAAASSGDTVQVASGQYDESITIDESGLTLSGDGSTVDTTGTAIEVTAADVIVEGFRFRNATVGVETTADGTTIRTSQFFASVTNGTDIKAADVGVKNNRFDGLTTALSLTGNARNASIRSNNIYDNDLGVYANAGVHVMRQNNIERNDVAIDADRPQADSITEIDARNNYWGRPGGPRADEILSPVTVQPFLTDANEDPDYQITDQNLDTIDEVVEGEAVDVTYTVENTGGTAGNDITDSLVLELDGDQVAESTEFELGAGGTLSDDDAEFDTLTFEVDSSTAATLDSGDLELSTNDDTASSSVDVWTAPDFEASITDSPNELDTDDSLTVDADIENEGQAAGTETVALTLDGATVDTQDVTVSGSGSESVTLSTTLDENDIGTDLLVDVLPTDGQQETVTIDAAPEPTPTTGGGGGGPSARQANAETTGNVVEIGLNNLRSGETVSVDLDPTPASDAIGVAIRTIEIDSRTFDDATITVQSKTTPDGTVPDGFRSVFAYEVDTTLGAEDISEVQTTLTVESDAIESDDPADIGIIRTEDGETWETLDTEVTESDGVYQIVITADGFSEYAVVEPAIEAAPEEEIGEAPDEAPEEAPLEEETEPEPTEEPAELPGFGVGVAVAALLAAALLANRRS